MKLITILGMLTIASFAVTAEGDLMSTLDVNNDGKISIEEASKDAAISAIFTDLDLDGDGFLTPEELVTKP